MKTKLLIGLGIFAAATTALTIGIIHELRAIRALTVDADDLEALPEEDAEVAVLSDEAALAE